MSKTPEVPNKRAQSEPERWLADYGDAMYQYALARLRDQAKAEDAVQESLLAALSALDRFRGEAAERTWLFGILKHKILDQYRRDAREVPIGDEEEADALINQTFDSGGSWRVRPVAWQDPGRDLERDEFWAMFERCLDGLPQTLAATVRLVEIDELDSDETCKALGISATNLGVRLHRARLRLRECIERSWFLGNRTRRKRP